MALQRAVPQEDGAKRGGRADGLVGADLCLVDDRRKDDPGDVDLFQADVRAHDPDDVGSFPVDAHAGAWQGDARRVTVP